MTKFFVWILIMMTALPPYPLFADTCLFIEDKQGRMRPFIRNEIQRKYRRLKRFAQKRLGKKRFIVLKYRRGGITTEEQATSFYEIMKGNKKCLTLAHTKDDAEVIFGIATNFYNQLENCVKPPKSRSEKREIKLLAPYNSRFYIETARKSASARGSTLQRVHASEVAFWPGQEHDLRNLIVSLSEATSHGIMVLETTANGFNHYYKMWKREKENPDSEWGLIFLPWFQDSSNFVPTLGMGEQQAILASLSDEESLLRERHNITPEQIKWRRRKLAELGRLFYQEYPESDEAAFLHTGSCFFDKSVIIQRIRECKNPIETRWGGRLKIWSPPKPGMEYVAGSDVGEGIDDQEHDASVTTILERVSGKHCATLHCRWKPNEFAHRSYELVKEYNNAFWGVELQQSGHAVVNTIINTIGYVEKLYRHEYYDERKEEYRKKYGWPTNVKTRPIMLGDLAEAIEGNLTISYDAEFYNECQIFTGNKHGKYAARKTAEHDDRVLAYSIAWQMRNAIPKTPSVEVF